MQNTTLTHFSLSSFYWDIDKQYRTRPDAADCAVWSGSSLFAQKWSFKILIKMKNIPANTPKIGNGFVLLIEVSKSIRLKWVNFYKTSC